MTKSVSVDLAYKISLNKTEDNPPVFIQDRMVYNFKIMVDSSSDWILVEDRKTDVID